MAENGTPFTPYVKSLNPDDPLMKRVPMKQMDIGANSAGMPKGMGERPGQIEHVSGGVKGRG